MTYHPSSSHPQQGGLAFDPVVSERRRSFDERVLPWIESIVRFVARHWLALVNLALFVFVTLPALSPLLLDTDLPALRTVGSAIFSASLNPFVSSSYSKQPSSIRCFVNPISWAFLDRRPEKYLSSANRASTKFAWLGQQAIPSARSSSIA